MNDRDHVRVNFAMRANIARDSRDREEEIAAAAFGHAAHQLLVRLARELPQYRPEP